MFGRPFLRVGRPGLLGTMARTAVVAGTATAVVGGMNRRRDARAQEEAEAEAFREQQQTPTPAPWSSPQPTAVPPAPDLISQLERLGQLRSTGVLTDAEFEAQKARLLQS